jgi:Helicase associated domain
MDIGWGYGFKFSAEDRIPAERKARLSALGLVFDPLGTQWEKGFEHLQAFVNEHGHCGVPRGYLTADGYRLGAWVSNQRNNQDRVSRVSAERKARLDALGFIWDALTSPQWEVGFEHLEAFVNERGHCRVPYSHISEDGYRSGQWISTQRTCHDSMLPERRSRLDALGYLGLG